MNIVKRKTTNDLFSNFAKSFFDDDFNLFTLKPYHQREIGSVNIQETDDKYKFQISVPGFKKDDINIEIDNNILTISSEYENKNEKDEDGYTYKEFVKTSFKRSFTVPDDVNINDINANMEDGILNIDIKKIKKENKNNKISIEIK